MYHVLVFDKKANSVKKVWIRNDDEVVSLKLKKLVVFRSSTDQIAVLDDHTNSIYWLDVKAVDLDYV